MTYYHLYLASQLIEHLIAKKIFHPKKIQKLLVKCDDLFLFKHEIFSIDSHTMGILSEEFSLKLIELAKNQLDLYQDDQPQVSKIAFHFLKDYLKVAQGNHYQKLSKALLECCEKLSAIAKVKGYVAIHSYLDQELIKMYTPSSSVAAIGLFATATTSALSSTNRVDANIQIGHLGPNN